MHPEILPAAGRPAAMGQLFPACTGMSGYSRRGRGASGPPLVISKYSPASVRTSSIAPLCPPAPPALGREFRFQKAMMVFRSRRFSQKYGCQSEIPSSQAYSSVSQSVFPGPVLLNNLVTQKVMVFPEAIVRATWPAAGWDSSPILHACCMLNRIDRLIYYYTSELSGCGRRRARAAVLQPCMAYSLQGPSWPTLIQINPTKIPPSAPPGAGWCKTACCWPRPMQND